MRISRSNRLIFIIGGLMFAAYFLMAVFVVQQEFQSINSACDNELLNTSRIIATDPIVIEKINNLDLTLNDEIDGYFIDVPQLALIEILDMNGIRYSHVNDVYIGQPYNGTDHQSALNGEEYIITENSTVGETRKSFIPIYDGTNQIGVAIVEILSEDIDAMKLEKALTLSVGFGVGFVLSIIGLLWLSRKFKSELFGFRPDEIALLYAENRSVIEQLNEALISIDRNYKVTTVNKTLFKLFQIDEEALGKNVQDVFPYIDFRPLIEEKIHITNKYKKINELKLLMNAFPLYLDGEIIGATAVFRSHLEVDALVDQVKGYQQIAEALRSQKHEFQNKLHVVLGLIKMKDYLQAENYIMENVYTTNLASDYYSSRLKDDKLLALFVGKEIQSKEYNSTLLLTSDSFIGKQHSPVSSDDLVLVLGNLIDNSFEAYIGKDVEDKHIVVDIFEDEDMIKLTVIDEAGGIDPKIIDRMFERGVSTKNGQSRGTGLSLVNEIVSLYNGQKNIYSSKEETKIEIILMKVIR